MACLGAWRAAPIHQLDEGLLVNIFSLLPLKDRVAGTALVCRRWRELSASRQLLEVVCVKLSGADVASVLPRLRALLLWLLRHAPHATRTLSLALSHGGPPGGGAHMPSEGAAEAVALLNNCATVCAAATRLSISHCATLVPNGWVVALRGLREVRLHADTRLHMLSTLEGLSQMRCLELTAPGILMAPGVHLPRGLTSLVIAEDRGLEMLPQFGELTALHTLHLRGVGYGSAGFSPLPKLRGLRSLHLDGCRLPACLPSLSSLEALRLCGVHAGHTGHGAGGDSLAAASLAAELDAALRPLSRQLTCLTLAQLPAAATCPPALAGLCSVQLLTVVPCLRAHDTASLPGLAPALAPGAHSNGGGGGGGGGFAGYCAGGSGCYIAACRMLAAVPWPATLRRLTTSYALACASLPWLASAQHLQHLRLMDPPTLVSCGTAAAAAQQPAPWDFFWAWAEAHPSLLRLEFPGHSTPGAGAEALHRACHSLAARRPDLQIVRVTPPLPTAHPAPWQARPRSLLLN